MEFGSDNSEVKHWPRRWCQPLTPIRFGANSVLVAFPLVCGQKDFLGVQSVYVEESRHRSDVLPLPGYASRHKALMQSTVF